MDKVIVAAPSSAAIEQALGIVKKRGVIVLFGGLPRNNSYTRLDANVIHYNDLRIIGHFGQDLRHVILSLELIRKGKINAEKLITHVLPLERIFEGFELIKNRMALKVLIKP